MAKPDVLTMSTISLAVMVVSGFLWAQTYFMTRVDADAVHDTYNKALTNAVIELKKSDKVSYLELKIDQYNGNMAFIERGGVQSEEQRQYDLMKFSVERMTQTLMSMEK